jgi:SAM-dependent methyltransferase
MDYDDKSNSALALEERQQGNQKWWTDHTMSYDWKDKIGHEPFSLPWFDQIDARFCYDARLYATRERPFAEMMDLDNLKGKRVLEIGCGMGFHSELLKRAGAILTSVDLSPTSVSSTEKRFALKGMEGDIRQMDAEHLDFPDGEFDMVWSWGVIHHSSHTGRIMREIARVTKPGGNTRIMVYYLGGMTAYATIVRRYLTGFWRGKDLDDLLWADTDGFSARFYTKDSLRDILSIFFDSVEFKLCGQDPDVVPLPRFIRGAVLKLVSEKTRIRLAAKRGAMIFAVATKAD